MSTNYALYEGKNLVYLAWVEVDDVSVYSQVSLKKLLVRQVEGHFRLRLHIHRHGESLWVTSAATTQPHNITISQAFEFLQNSEYRNS